MLTVQRLITSCLRQNSKDIKWRPWIASSLEAKPNHQIKLRTSKLKFCYESPWKWQLLHGIWIADDFNFNYSGWECCAFKIGGKFETMQKYCSDFFCAKIISKSNILVFIWSQRGHKKEKWAGYAFIHIKRKLVRFHSSYWLGINNEKNSLIF